MTDYGSHGRDQRHIACYRHTCHTRLVHAHVQFFFIGVGTCIIYIMYVGKGILCAHNS